MGERAVSDFVDDDADDELELEDDDCGRALVAAEWTALTDVGTGAGAGGFIWEFKLTLFADAVTGSDMEILLVKACLRGADSTICIPIFLELFFVLAKTLCAVIVKRQFFKELANENIGRVVAFAD